LKSILVEGIMSVLANIKTREVVDEDLVALLVRYEYRLPNIGVPIPGKVSPGIVISHPQSHIFR
jgi:hypothetical protein